MIYDNYKDDNSRCWEGRGVIMKKHVPRKKVLDMFRKHSEKQITILTQSLFDLANTFDTTFRKKIMDSINTSNPFILDEVKEMVDVFAKIQEKREDAVHSNHKGEERYNFEEEYSKLFPYVDKAIKRIDQFATQAFCEYHETEKKVFKMLKKFKETPSN